ncbi:MAG: OmpA family protein [Pseudomonadota bacterium]
MRGRAWLWVAVLAWALVGGPLAAETDLGAPEGAVRTAEAVEAFDTYALPIAPFDKAGPTTRAVSGKLTWRAYRLEGASVGQVIAGYRDRLLEMGFTPLLDCRAMACGGFAFRFGAELLPAPGMLFDTAEFAQLSLVREGEAASILASQVLDTVYVQTVLAVEGSAPQPMVDSAPTAEEVDPLFLPQDEKALFDRLVAEGHVPVAGLDFEVGGARLSEGSGRALDMLARLLNRNDIQVMIVGHSDTAGGLEPNLALSRDRARSVRQALIERGVAASQMGAEGVAFLAPIASNATEAGRAQNRRVELVLIGAN